MVFYVFWLFKTSFDSTHVLEDEMPKFKPKVHNFTVTPFLCKKFPAVIGIFANILRESTLKSNLTEQNGQKLTNLGKSEYLFC